MEKWLAGLTGKSLMDKFTFFVKYKVKNYILRYNLIKM